MNPLTKKEIDLTSGGNAAGGNSAGDRFNGCMRDNINDRMKAGAIAGLEAGFAAGAATGNPVAAGLLGISGAGAVGGAATAVGYCALETGAKSASKSSRVICTHFMRKGLMDPALWRADIAFTRQHLPAAMVRGYHLWAIPYVRLMRRSPWAEKLMLPLALWRAEEIAFRMGLREKGNWKGKLLRWTGEPVCWLIGKVTPEQDWESLWRENSAAV